MKPNNKIFDYILITLAIFSISYFILLILNSRFITSYFLYLIFACICILYSYYELKNKTSILSKLPKIINYIIKGIICISIILFIIIEGLIINEANNSYCKQTDFVIVLGGKIKWCSSLYIIKIPTRCNIRILSTISWNNNYSKWWSR